jgi:hypothetical protein
MPPRATGLAPALLVAAVCGLLLGAPAWAATAEIGRVNSTGGDLPVGCGNPCSTVLTQLLEPDGGPRLTSPADGVVTSWRVHGNTDGSTARLALRILHPTPTGEYKGTGRSVPVVASMGDGSPARSTNLPITVGDAIGVETLAGASADEADVYDGPLTGATIGWWEGGFADGSTGSPSMTISGRELELGATVKLAVPIVSALGVKNGSTDGGGSVTIAGKHLANASRVLFGGVPATITSNSNTQVTVVPPPHAPGTFGVQVTTIGGDSPPGGESRYTYVSPAGPSIDLLTLQPTAFRAGAAGGTRVLIRVSEALQVRYTVQRRTRGVKRKGHCVKGRARKRRKRCIRYVRAGGFTRFAPAGLSTFRFAGRVGGRKLRPGRYRLVARGANSSGQRTKPRRRTFRVKR